MKVGRSLSEVIFLGEIVESWTKSQIMVVKVRVLIPK